MSSLVVCVEIAAVVSAAKPTLKYTAVNDHGVYVCVSMRLTLPSHHPAGCTVQQSAGDTVGGTGGHLVTGGTAVQVLLVLEQVALLIPLQVALLVLPCRWRCWFCPAGGVAGSHTGGAAGSPAGGAAGSPAGGAADAWQGY